MAEFDIFPDAERVVTHWLINGYTWVGVEPDVGTEYAPDSALPILIVQRIGGQPIEKHRLDNPRLQIDAWSELKPAAHALAREARVAIHKLEGQTYQNAVITQVNDDLGLSWQPDPTSLTPRYLFGVSLILHAA